MKRTLTVLLAAAAFPAVAFAGDMDFKKIDADGSGGISFPEMKMAAPDVSEEQFAAYDQDNSGELGEDEFDAWIKESSEG